MPLDVPFIREFVCTKYTLLLLATHTFSALWFQLPVEKCVVVSIYVNCEEKNNLNMNTNNNDRQYLES